MLKRRTLIQAAITGAGLSLLPFSLLQKSYAEEIGKTLQDSDLIYLTPIQSNGNESSCQSEIWYVWDGSDIFVCTKSTSWRATAPGVGLNHTRIWVGDMGNWTGTDGKYKTLPKIEAKTSIVTDTAVHKRALAMFGKKYPFAWIRYKSEFTNGLADGSRTLLRYQPISI